MKWNTFDMVSIRRANENDVDSLVQLRVDFLTELFTLDTASVRQVTDASREYFTSSVGRDDFAAWLAESGGDVIGTGMVVYISRPPRFQSLAGKDAYLMGMYTVPSHRRQGVASRVLQEIVASVKQTDARCVMLYAMEGGRGIYERAGFEYKPNNMQLTW